MARIIESKIESEIIVSSYNGWQYFFIGALLGVLFGVFVEILKNFTDSRTIPGDVSTIIVAVIGILAMVRLNLVRPLIISVASALTLWGLANWTMGLYWLEAMMWFMILYGMTYLVFSWFVRFIKIIPALIAVIIGVILLRMCLVV